MAKDNLVHKCRLQVGEEGYDVFVFLEEGGRHIAKTFFAPEDVIINDGSSLDEVLDKHLNLLPLAVDSRQMLKNLQRETAQKEN